MVRVVWQGFRLSSQRMYALTLTAGLVSLTRDFLMITLSDHGVDQNSYSQYLNQEKQRSS